MFFVTAAAIAGCGEPASREPAAQASPDGASAEPADIVFRNGSIYTVDINRSWASAVAVKDGRIAYVGTDEGLGDWTGEATRVVDLAGKLMLPGFQDVHIHPISGGIEAAACDLNGLTSLDEYLQAIRTYAEENPDEEWIMGGGWSMSVFGPGALANR